MRRDFLQFGRVRSRKLNAKLLPHLMHILHRCTNVKYYVCGVVASSDNCLINASVGNKRRSTRYLHRLRALWLLLYCTTVRQSQGGHSELLHHNYTNLIEPPPLTTRSLPVANPFPLDVRLARYSNRNCSPVTARSESLEAPVYSE